MLRRRLTIRFALPMTVAGLLLIVLAVLIFSWMFKKLENIEIERNFSPLGISRLIEEAVIDEQGLIVNEQLLKQLEQDGGWLQSLDEQGHVLQSFYVPEDVPSQYNPAQLLDYWKSEKPFPYQIGLWIQPKNDRLFIMLYGKAKSASIAIPGYIEQAELDGKEIRFPQEVEHSLASQQAWVQVIDNSGHEVAAWQKPDYAADSYMLSDLALHTSYPQRYGTMLQSHYDEQSKLTWIVQAPFEDRSLQPVLLPGLEAELQVIIIAIVLFFVASLLIMLMLAFGYANMFVRPVFDIMSWIQRLGDEQQHPQFAAADRKRKKHLFREVRDAVDSLAAALHASKNAAKQTQAYREEWIAGVTHDMRTPLSSIQGYAHMLAANQYSWSEQEVRAFAATILEKSQYMDQLIEDLALTYRLRSGNMPVSLEQHDIGSLLIQTVERASAHPACAGRSISCIVPNETIRGYIHPPWFERIVENLIANAVLHNPSDTKIDIGLQPLDAGGWMLVVQDDGEGMDTDTIEQLFERYYRGTNTDEVIAGSGLGMAITKELVQAMNGKIEVSSQPTLGTTIRLIWREASDTNTAEHS